MEPKEIVIKAAEEFYLNKDNGLHLTDLEYDQLLDQVKKQDPNFDIFEHIGQTGMTVKHQFLFPPACKIKVNNKSWMIHGLKLNTIRKLLSEKNQSDTQLYVPFILNYQNGNLKFVSICNVIEEGDQVAVVDLSNKYFPKKLNIQGNFRLIGSFDILPNNDLSNIKIYGQLTETETGEVDKLKVRCELIKTDQALFFTMAEMPKWIYSIDLQRKYDQWWLFNIISHDQKFTCKMDGCSLVVYYKNSKLWYIASRSNDVTGKLKTRYLREFFPEELPVGNSALMFESVIDLAYGLGWNSRQNANGLINSKYRRHDISKMLNFVCYDAINIDTYERLDLNKLRESIYHNNHIEYVRKNLLDEASKFGICSLDSILSSEDYRNYIGMVHNMNGDNTRFENLMWLQGGTFEDIVTNIDKIGEANQKQLSEINKTLTDPLRTIVHLSNGIADGIRYCKVIFRDEDNLEEYPLYLVDYRDLYKPKVTTVDYFSLTEYGKFISPDCQAHYSHSDGGIYLIDGIVTHSKEPHKVLSKVYNTDDSHKFPFHRIYKWNYNEIAESTVRNIAWQESQYGTFIPVIEWEPVVVEGSTLSRASAGGLSKFHHMKCGPGAVIKVVRINSTIPQVIQVIKEEPYELPKCPHCGKQLTWNEDVYHTIGGAMLLKCMNPSCIGKFNRMNNVFEKYSDFNGLTNDVKILGELIPIESYKPRDYVTDEYLEIINLSIKARDYNTFRELLIKHIFVNMNNDKLNSFDCYCYAAFIAIRIKLNLEIESNES